ncbi:MAG TPA: 2-dehydropantoate 2-reductase [Actinomadura sp.]|jgi:2-dehydropantoate 2-reductase|nr:2-dehydropantoate 2-reductase [Actinomadura sp.]
MRFIVYGAGAVGGVIGARLFQAGHDVTLIARGPHLAALREHGLLLETPDEAVRLRIPVAGHPGEVSYRPGDVVLLAMKTQDTAEALRALAASAPSEIVVVCAQNGVENERLALRAFARVYGVCVVLPAAHLRPGVVQVYSAPVAGVLDVGRYPEGADDTALAIVSAFRDGGFRSDVRPDVMTFKYGKLLANLGNAAEVVCGPGEAMREIADLARREGAACLRAAGIGFTEADMGVYADVLRLRPVNDRHRFGGSSVQSLQRATGTVEADYLNGEIVLLGRRHGVPTPVNDLLRRLANEMARRRRPPGLVAPEEFLTRLAGHP